jgi:hypothetical protein
LARKARSDNIHKPSPEFSIEGCNIVPDGSVMEVTFLDPFLKDGLRPLVFFNVTDGSEADKVLGGKKPSASATKKGEFGKYIHMLLFSLETICSSF